MLRAKIEMGKTGYGRSWDLYQSNEKKQRIRYQKAQTNQFLEPKTHLQSIIPDKLRGFYKTNWYKISYIEYLH